MIRSLGNKKDKLVADLTTNVADRDKWVATVDAWATGDPVHLPRRD